ncbi:unnamed protein product [Heterobilharzia americana]|nr:unnamed protein product [Heterobilharzia americana]
MVSILAVLVAAYSSSLVCDTAFGSGVITNENVPIPATFQVLSNNSNICLLVQCNINLSSVDTKIPQPPIFPVVNSTNQDEFTATGSCNEHMETLQLIWKQNNSDSEWKLLFQFALNDKNNFNLTQINLSYEHNHSQAMADTLLLLLVPKALPNSLLKHYEHDSNVT